LEQKIELDLKRDKDNMTNKAERENQKKEFEMELWRDIEQELERFEEKYSTKKELKKK